MGSFSTALVAMAVVVLSSAVACGLAIVADEVRIRREQVRRNAQHEGTEDAPEEAVHGVVFRD